MNEASATKSVKRQGSARRMDNIVSLAQLNLSITSSSSGAERWHASQPAVQSRSLSELCQTDEVTRAFNIIPSFLPSSSSQLTSHQQDIISMLGIRTCNCDILRSALPQTVVKKPYQSENVHVVSSRVAPDVKFGRSTPKSGRFVHGI